MKKSKSPVEKIIKNLIKLTTVPIEKSVIKWRMDKVFGQYRFEAKYKDKIYVFDGRHFIVCNKQDPDLLLNIKINVAPKLLGELWMLICGQHDKELAEDQAAREREVKISKQTQEAERKHVLENTERILKDFK